MILVPRSSDVLIPYEIYMYVSINFSLVAVPVRQSISGLKPYGKSSLTSWNYHLQSGLYCNMLR